MNNFYNLLKVIKIKMDYSSLTIKELKKLADERMMYGVWSVKSITRKADIIAKFKEYDNYLEKEKERKIVNEKKEEAHRTTRNMKNIGQQDITKDLIESLEYPFSFLDGEYPLEVDSIPGQPNEDVGNFPDNIAHYYWIHPGQNDEEPWITLCKLDNGVFVFYKGECDYTGFDCQGYMELYASKDPFVLVKYAMTSEDYNKYKDEAFQKY